MPLILVGKWILRWWVRKLTHPTENSQVVWWVREAYPPWNGVQGFVGRVSEAHPP
ncbi:hypothetical protein SMX40_001915 [Cronobacter turicensis]|nr:hypothetical protein [Cronobacter turicensis]ELY3626762.1 hypothetical protein [Cronobacter turicensis]